MNETTGTTDPANGPGPSQPYAPPTQLWGPPPRPRLERSRSDRKVAGVAGGIAAYFGIDPLILRIVIVVLTIFGGSGLLLYAAGWLLIPDQGEEHSEIERLIGRDRAHGPSVGAVVVTVIGVIVLVTSLSLGAAFGGWGFGGPDLWPLIVVGAVVALVWYARRDRPSPVPPVPPVPTVPPTAAYPAAGSPSTAPVSQATEASPMSTTTPTAGGPDAPTLVDTPVGVPAAAAAVPVTAPSGGGDQPPGYPWATPQPPPPPPPAPPREHSVLGPVTFWLTLVAAGVMWLFDRTGAWHVTALTFFAVLLGIVGAGLVVGAFVGRSRGLIALGIVLSVVTAVVGAVPAVGHGRTGTVTWTPTSVAAIPSDGYNLAAGKATLDLSGTRLDSTADVRVQVGAGRLLVIVPANARVVLHANVGVGSLRGPDGRQDDGFGSTVDGVYGALSGPPITLRLDLGVGSMEVRYAQA